MDAKIGSVPRETLPNRPQPLSSKILDIYCVALVQVLGKQQKQPMDLAVAHCWSNHGHCTNMLPQKVN